MTAHAAARRRFDRDQCSHAPPADQWVTSSSIGVPTMQATIEIILALLPFAVLVAGFLVFRLDSLQTSLAAWIAEFAIIFGYYHMGLLKSVESALWGGLTMWTGFLVVYTGMIFGQAYRTTGLLRVLLDSVESIFPARDKEGRAIALVAVVGGFIGAFNGFATYPVTIPGLVELGFDGVRAIASYLVYFAWSVPFVSLFIGANIANAATQLPIADIAAASGLFGIPLVFISLAGFLKILGFRFFERETQILFWLLGLGNSLGIVLFCLIWPTYYILTLIAASAFSLVLLYGYGLYAKRAARGAAVAQPLSAAVSPAASRTPAGAWRAYAPLVLGAAFVVVTMIPAVARELSHLQIRVAAWGYAPITINLITSAGFVILVTAALCYLFRCKPANALADVIAGSKRSVSALVTLFIGSAMVYQMVDTGQIAMLGRALSNGGSVVYTALFPFFAFLGGMAFGQGLPADFLFAHMQIPVAPALGISLVLLVGIVNVITMGPPNPLKPAQITYCTHLVDVKGRDWEIFRINLPWQILQLLATAILALVLVFI
jgi:lactate permease